MKVLFKILSVQSQSIFLLSFEDGESAKGTVIFENLDVNSVWNDLAILLELVIFSLCELSETELSADENSLSTWELEHGSSEGFLSVSNVGSVGSDGHNDISNGNTSGLTVGFTPSLSHTLLKSICSSA